MGTCWYGDRGVLSKVLVVLLGHVARREDKRRSSRYSGSEDVADEVQGKDVNHGAVQEDENSSGPACLRCFLS